MNTNNGQQLIKTEFDKFKTSIEKLIEEDKLEWFLNQLTPKEKEIFSVSLQQIEITMLDIKSAKNELQNRKSNMS
jgi:hypothetical protein